MPSVHFTLSQSDIVCARNNTIATLDTTGLTPNADSYFLVSIFDGATKITESYFQGTDGFGKLLLSEQLQAYSEAKTIDTEMINEEEFPLLLLTAKCAYHHIVAGVDTVYNAPDIVFNLLLAQVPNVYYRTTTNPSFKDLYENILNFKFLTYTPDNEIITATEQKGLSFLAYSSSTTREGFADYENFRIQYFLAFEDETTETIISNLPGSIDFGTIKNIKFSVLYIDTYIKSEPKKIKYFKIKIIAYNGSYDVALTNYRTYIVDNRAYEFERTFCFLNSLNGWEYFSTHGYRKVSVTSKKERFISFSDLSIPKNINQAQTINIDTRQKAIIDTGAFDRQKIAAIQEIIESPLVYLVKRTGNAIDHIPINILTEKLVSFDDDDYRDSFTFEYEFNHNETSTQDFIN